MEELAILKVMKAMREQHFFFFFITSVEFVQIKNTDIFGLKIDEKARQRRLKYLEIQEKSPQ